MSDSLCCCAAFTCESIRRLIRKRSRLKPTVEAISPLERTSVLSPEFQFGADFLGAQRVAMRKGNVVYFLHGDHLGSTSLTTDAGGGLVSQARYLPYGETRWGGTGPTDFGFTGQRSDSFGLMDFNARFYSPFLGRFVSPDTIVPGPGSPPNFNRYTYGLNNPLAYNDPSGHWPGWFEGLAGALYQFSNDMTLSAPNLAFGTDWQEDQSDAFHTGQQVGRAFSTAVSTVLIVDGGLKIAAGISVMPPTAGVGAACTALTEGACAPPAGAVIVVEGITVGAGIGEVILGNAVLQMAAKNPVGGGGKQDEEPGRWGVGSSQTKTIKGYKVRVDWESPGSKGNVHVTIDKEKVYVTDPSDLSMLPKALRNNEWIQKQVERAFEQMRQFEGQLPNGN